MDTYSPIGSTAVDEHVLSSVSWDALKNDPVARLFLLKEVREVPGAEKMIPEFYDSLRMIAMTSSAEQEGLKESLGDMLAALGIELQTGDTSSAVPTVPDTKILDTQIKEAETILSQTTTPPVTVASPSDANQGFGNHRLLPDFPVPDAVAPVSVPEIKTPMPEPDASASIPVPTAQTAVPIALESVDLSLDDIEKGLHRIRDSVGVPRFLEALKGDTSVDAEYTSAFKALNALGNPDTVPIADLRQAYRRLTEAAEHLSQADNEGAQNTVVPDVPVGAPLPPVETIIPEAQDALPPLPPVETVAPNVASSVGVPSWSSSAAGADAKDTSDAVSEDVPTNVPVTPAVAEETVAPQPPVDAYREPTESTEEVPVAPSPQTQTPSTNPYREPVVESSPVTPEVGVAEAPIAQAELENQTPQEVSSADGGAPIEIAPQEAMQETATAEPQGNDAALMDPQVTEGLKELLSGWNIFEKSGWFGFGAHGIEHPLYKQLAPIPMRALVSGRWEGADPAVTRNIQEYVQGWKQECGIDADPEEPFEIYLRRVIAQIIEATPAPQPATA